jgi:hypothetical protein
MIIAIINVENDGMLIPEIIPIKKIPIVKGVP